MKASECTLKARVGFISGYGGVSRGSVIVEPTTLPNGQEVVVVEWDNGGIQKLGVSSLVPEAEIAAEEARAKAEKERLEAEFAVVAAKVKEKADAAAALINEAQELASTIGREARYMNDACDNLQDALDSSGWYQSSYSC
jgi:hypothetical protein